MHILQINEHHLMSSKGNLESNRELESKREQERARERAIERAGEQARVGQSEPERLGHIFDMFCCKAVKREVVKNY